MTATPTSARQPARAIGANGKQTDGTEDVRILIIDDMPAIHEDFRKILGEAANGDLDAAADALFGGSSAPHHQIGFQLDSAYQGSEGLALLQGAVAAGRPYAIAFVDVRMPPGWDGLETSSRLWEVDPDLQIVICTAYSDHSWDQLTSRLGRTDSLLILRKPFDNIEVLQLAHSLAKKWALTREARHRLTNLEAEVNQRTAEVRASETRFRTVVEKAPSAIGIFRGGFTLYVNQKYLDLFGFQNSDELVGRPLAEQWSPEWRPFIEERAGLRSLGLAAPMEFEGIAQRKDGSLFPAQVTLAIVDLPDGPATLAFIADITQRKQAEQSLKASEARSRSYFELPLVGLAITNPEKGWIAANDRLCSILGYSWEELRHTDWARLTHPDDLTADLRQFNRMMAGEIDSYALEKRFVRKDRAIIWTSLAAGCARKPNGAVDFVCASIQDITERRPAEAARRESPELPT